MSEQGKIYKKKFNFGKIDLFCIGRRINEVDVELKLRERFCEGFKYYEFSACGNVWNSIHTDIKEGGQCLDDILLHIRELTNPILFKTIHKLWKAYHLNSLKAGAPEQEAAVKEWLADGKRYDYTEARAMLEGRGLLTVPFYGMTTEKVWNGEPYRYGSGCVIEVIPDYALRLIAHIMGIEIEETQEVGMTTNELLFGT